VLPSEPHGRSDTVEPIVQTGLNNNNNNTTKSPSF
jgi:hypothetical protein